MTDVTMHNENPSQYLFNITEVELIYRNRVKMADRINISCPEDAVPILRAIWDVNKIELVEQFKILLLDHSNSLLGFSDIAKGGITSCLVDPRIVFSTALKARATRIILAHNHPSGSLKVSLQDLTVTKKMMEAGRVLDIEVVDHMILTAEGYYSMADDCVMPTLKK